MTSSSEHPHTAPRRERRRRDRGAHHPLGAPGRAGAPHTLLPPAAAEAPPGPTGQMHPAAPSPNAAPRTRIPSLRRWPGPHLPLRHGLTRLGSARRDSAQPARHSPAQPLRPLRQLPLTDRRHPAMVPPSVSSQPIIARSRRMTPPIFPPRPITARSLPRLPGLRPAGFPRSGRGFLPSRPRPAIFPVPSRCACAFSRRGGVGSGRRSPHDRPPCWLWLSPVPGPAVALGSFMQGVTGVLGPPRSPFGGTSVPQQRAFPVSSCSRESPVTLLLPPEAETFY